MQVGMIGLGRMGANMVRRLLRGGHTCVVHDVSAAAVQALVHDGATGATSLDAFVKQLYRRASSMRRSRASSPTSSAATSSSTAGTPTTVTTSTARLGSPAAGSTTWTAARAAACSVSSAATAS